jgi:hypothetical protein
LPLGRSGQRSVWSRYFKNGRIIATNDTFRFSGRVLTYPIGGISIDMALSRLSGEPKKLLVNAP